MRRVGRFARTLLLLLGVLSAAPHEPATVEKRANTSVRSPLAESMRMRVKRAISGFVTVKCP